MLEVITETGKEKNMKLFNDLVEKRKKEKEEKMKLKENWYSLWIILISAIHK